MADNLLAQGIAAVKAGRKADARELLKRLLEQDASNEMAWLWLSGAVDTDQERRTCLENVLAINPNNQAGRRGLESLIAKEGVRPLSAVSPPMLRAEPTATPREQPTQIPAEASVPDVTRRKKRIEAPRRRKVTGRQTGLIISLGAVILVLACVAFVGIWWAINSGLLQLGPAMSVIVDVTQTPSAADQTPTPIPSPTWIPTWTPTIFPTNTPSPTRTPRPTSTPTLGTYSNPLPVGQSATLYDVPGIYQMTATVLEIHRGDEANEVAQSELDWLDYDEPIEEQEYIAVRVRLEVISGPSQEVYKLFPWMHLGLRYEPSGPSVGIHNATALLGDGYLPLEGEGWIFFLVRKGSEPLLYFQPNLAASESLGIPTSGVFFTLTEP